MFGAEEAGVGRGTIESVGLLSLAPQMQTPNRGLTIKQYQPTIQPISVTPATTIQPIATVVTGSNVKDDYERASSILSSRTQPSLCPTLTTLTVAVLLTF